MDDARRTVFAHGVSRVRNWPIWSLPKPLQALWLAVTCGYLAWVSQAASGFQVHLADVGLFAALVGCVAFSVEMARRASEPVGIVKDVYAVWEFPVVILLPGLYALLIPAIRLALTQVRVRRAPVYRRVYTAAAIGIAYSCARLAYHAISPPGLSSQVFLWANTGVWLIAALGAALVQWAVNQVLVLGAVKLAEPSTKIVDQVLGREALHNDATELCAAMLVAVGTTVSNLMLVIALPLATLLQRSVRHAHLLNEARADAKTGLLNAATWEREAATEIARAVRTSSPLAVALLDLDRFKLINDTHGHLVGDEVLRAIARALTTVLREYDVAGRFGGEEFVILLPQTRAPDAFKIADRVREHIAGLPISAADGERVHVTVSIGVAALDAGSSRELTELLAAADAALYRAKASGRDQVQMISTIRGLSAVRPPSGDDLDVQAGPPWQPAERPADSVAPTAVVSVDVIPANVVPVAVVPVGGPGTSAAGLPAGLAGPAARIELSAGDTASTATTSALAV